MALVHEPTTPRRTRIVAFAALAVVALVAVAVIALGGSHDKTTTRSPSRGKSQQTGKDATSETLTAENVKFNDVYGAQIPSSPAGPKETTGGRALGFERSPAGAVLAAINIFARAESRSGPGVFEPTITEQVTGPDKDKLLENSQKGYADRATQGTGPDGALISAIENARNNRSSLWAYRIDSYDDSSVAVNLLLRTVSAGTPIYVNFAVTVRWIKDDWRLVAPLNGEFSAAGQQLAEAPSGYVVIGKD
jgi:hypothetical protein